MIQNYLVTQSNQLIEARQIQPLTPREQKLVLTFVSMIQPDDDDFKVYSIQIKDFHKLLNIKGRANYTQIKNILKRLMTKTIEIPRENGYLITHWASHIEYISGEGRIEFSFEPKLKPYLLQLKRNFTSYRLINALMLNSSYSIRLYEVLKKWQNIGKWKTSVENLRMLLGATQKSYGVYGNFKNRILNPSVLELNKETDIDIKFTEIKKGRRVVELVFKIETLKISVPPSPSTVKSDGDAQDHTYSKESLSDKIQKEFSDFNIPFNVYKIVLSIANKIYPKDRIEEELLGLIDLTTQKSTENRSGFMIHIMKTKEELYHDGKDPSIVNVDLKSYSNEVIPDWFKNRNKQVSKPKNSKSFLSDMSIEELKKQFE